MVICYDGHMKILFVRHGESTANAESIVGTPDTRLTEAGLDQARKTGQSLKNQEISVIVCSPFIRARQTAEIIAGKLGIPLDQIVTIDELGERRMGELEGKLKQHATEFFYENDAKHGFETQKDLITRMQQAVQKVKIIAQKTSGTTLVVGHATSGFYLLEVAKGKTRFKDFDPVSQLDNAAFKEVRLA